MREKSLKRTSQKQTGLFRTYVTPLLQALRVSISSAPVFHAKEYQWQVKGEAWKTPDLVCGLSSCGCAEKSNQHTSSSKTVQQSEPQDSRQYCRGLPPWGMMRSGELSALPPLEPLIEETDGSVSRSYPTPTASPYGSNTSMSKDGTKGKARPSLQTLAKKGLLPTPTVTGNYNRKGASATSGDGLATVMGGPLNPEFVEWLMGFPMGWTEIER